ncbi:MAG: bacteriophage Gp15 family protein [Streptococcaceae bacterium]|nr:bacteriophage Gp15 family protein [Streptococcaceae bacterium]MCL2680900.1 bacteriophage Gp15 family protein [Streptococcaceae bacterium]MCL2858096.1 bacteriophage Gp15 family protein [Streptococcaceae bacterium]
MFKLNEPLTASIEFEAVTYPLNLSFDNVLDVYEILEDKTLNNFQKVDIALEFLISGKDVPFEKKARLFQTIFSEYIQKEEIKEVYDLKGNVMPRRESEPQERLFSFAFDAEIIFVSFMQAYHMDLHEQIGHLSWKKFQMLFKHLPDDTKFKQVLEIRTWKPKKNTSTEEKQRMMELQEIYELPD